MKQNDSNGLTQLDTLHALLAYNFPEERPIFWGMDQTFQDYSSYSPPKNWHYNELVSIPKVVRFLHDAGVVDDQGGNNGPIKYRFLGCNCATEVELGKTAIDWFWQTDHGVVQTFSEEEGILIGTNPYMDGLSTISRNCKQPTAANEPT